MKIHHEVISIHPERKTVSVKNLENGEILSLIHIYVMLEKISFQKLNKILII